MIAKKSLMHYFGGSVFTAVAGVLLIMGIFKYQGFTTAAMVQAGLTAMLLAVLEISLSFDNAVVNATVLKQMNEVWRRRFLTWGILIAVFGMRLLFPILIVTVVAEIDPWTALKLSFTSPDEYAKMMLSAHVPVAAFGGMFLFMVFVHYFFDHEKDVHWFFHVEKGMSKLSQFSGSEIAVSLMLLLFLTASIEGAEQLRFLEAGVWGIVTFLLVHGLSGLLETKQETTALASAGFGMFLYLEVLDASFSFDGVVGAFALTNSLIQIMIGLGIGAFFVRSLTIYLVENETLEQFRYLEHGAFYALGCLALLMLFGAIVHIPEWLTGLAGALILGLSVFWSIIEDRQTRTK